MRFWHFFLYNSFTFIFEFFMTNKPPSCTKKHHESIKPESCQMAKTFFLLLLLLLPLVMTFMVVFAQNSTAFSQVWSLKRCLILVTEELWLYLRHHFLHLYTCVIIIQDCWIRNTVGVHGDRDSLCHPLLTRCSMNRDWSMILHSILQTSTWPKQD